MAGLSLLAQSKTRDVYTEAASAFHQGQLDQSEQKLRRAITVEPHRPDLPGLLGLVLDAKKEYKEAESFHQRALKLARSFKPSAPLAGRARRVEGRALLALDRAETAVTTLERALELFRNTLMPTCNSPASPSRTSSPLKHCITWNVCNPRIRATPPSSSCELGVSMRLVSVRRP